MFAWFKKGSNGPRDSNGWLGELIDDLTNIEVNTILKENIAGTKMGEPRAVLEELALEYWSKLIEIAGNLGAPTEGMDKPGALRPDSYAKLRKWAHALETHASRRATEGQGVAADLNLLYRIDRKAESIDQILNADNVRPDLVSAGRPPLKLDRRQLIVLRKAWEIGTARIALQSVIQLDGDGVTYVDPKVVTDEHSALLLATHRSMVDTSVSFWRGLFAVVTEFARSLVSVK